MTSGLPLMLMLVFTAFLLWMTATDFEQYCLFDATMLPFALAALGLWMGPRLVFVAAVGTVLGGAAALAGAANFVNGDTIDAHPNADTFAARYVAANLGHNLTSSPNRQQFQA